MRKESCFNMASIRQNRIGLQGLRVKFEGGVLKMMGRGIRVRSYEELRSRLTELGFNEDVVEEIAGRVEELLGGVRVAAEASVPSEVIG
ncbi:hypothetical protein HY333_01605 [Candidatus Collierbacteria bacterium]|nr:hypothetical protein [Candidatus Collierbacteria bacterium]